jgi:hypothetical protein
MAQFKYSREELENAVATKSTAKKFANLTKRGTDFYIGKKKVIPTEEHQEWLRAFYDDPETGMRGRDALFAKIYADYAGISRRDIESWLKNWETAQIHQPVKRVTISRPLISTAPMKCWGIDLTFLKEISVDSTIKSDNGSEFVSNEFKAVCSEHDIKHLTTDTYSPQQNSISERFN